MTDIKADPRVEIAAFLIARDESLICEHVSASCMEWARGKLANGMRLEHSGDCTKESHSCQRCSADHALRDADAILAAITPTVLDRAAVIEECAKIADAHAIDAENRVVGLAYGELYGAQCERDMASNIASDIRAVLQKDTPCT